MKSILLVFLGGGVGSTIRFLISRNFNSYFQSFFLGTFLVNSIGCLLFGLFIGLSFRGNYLTDQQTLLLTTGFCGGFTTFSAFAFEKYELLNNGAYLQFLLYFTSSILIGVLAVALGVWLAKIL
jgi:CrcB protein